VEEQLRSQVTEPLILGLPHSSTIRTLNSVHILRSGRIASTHMMAILLPYSVTNVSQIDLAYDSNDQIEEFTVEWQYSFFTAEAPTGSRGEVSSIPVV